MAARCCQLKGNKDMTDAAMPVVLTIVYTMNDGSHTTMHRHFDASQKWDSIVMAARDVIRAQEAKYPGCVIAANLYHWEPHGGSAAVAPQAGFGKVFQPKEWAAA